MHESHVFVGQKPVVAFLLFPAPLPTNALMTGLPSFTPSPEGVFSQQDGHITGRTQALGQAPQQPALEAPADASPRGRSRARALPAGALASFSSRSPSPAR